MHKPISFLKYLTLKKLLNQLLIGFNYLTLRFLKIEFFTVYPYALTIEPTNLCNLRCPQCVTGLRADKAENGLMEFDDFKSIIDTFKGYVIMVQLHFRGEPMLNPKIFEFVKYASKNRIYTSIFTNGHYILQNEQKIIDSQPDHINISVDGLTQHVYEKYRIGGDLKKVMRGITSLAAHKTIIKRSKPRMTLQMLVSKNNFDQIEKFKKLTSIKGIDACLLKSMQVIDDKTATDFIPEKSGYIRKRKAFFFCTKTLTTAVFSWQGKLLPCCYDKQEDYVLMPNTNISGKKYLKAMAKQMQTFRKNILVKEKRPSICYNCEESYANIYPKVR